ncbi:MAG: site-specific integrase [Actinobacteria bacterium]|nr:site-specific integrase [Actinomycetota bacterium]
MTALAPVLQAFFCQHLAQRRASPHTIASYRDCFRLLLRFAQTRTGKQPAALALADLDAELIGAFLDHLETDRHNSIQTRNLRLCAIHSMFTYAQVQCPEQAEVIKRVLAIPPKRPNVTIVSFLTDAETSALLAAPDRGTLIGRRDHALLLTAIQTGLRVSELTALRCQDLTFATGANVYATGKGRRDRHTPLTPTTAKLLAAWLRDRRAQPEDPVFATRTGGHLSTDAVEDLVDKYVAAATTACPSLATKRVTPHTLRHTCAMNLLAAGVDLTTIALFLGHSSTRATEIYIHADLALKEQALARIAPTPTAARRYRPPDRLLAFLESL